MCKLHLLHGSTEMKPPQPKYLAMSKFCRKTVVVTIVKDQISSATVQDMWESLNITLRI